MPPLATRLISKQIQVRYVRLQCKLGRKSVAKRVTQAAPVIVHSVGKIKKSVNYIDWV